MDQSKGGSLTLIDLILFGLGNVVGAGIFIIISKSDLFPEGVDRNEFALDFLKTRYLNFYNNCKELQIKYDFEIKLYPYSIGAVKFQNLLIDFNTIPPSEIIQDVMNYTFVSRKSWINRFFK